eukprot:7383476-Prymnesium_polylepis.1
MSDWRTASSDWRSVALAGSLVLNCLLWSSSRASNAPAATSAASSSDLTNAMLLPAGRRLARKERPAAAREGAEGDCASVACPKLFLARRHRSRWVRRCTGRSSPTRAIGCARLLPCSS